MKHLEPEEKIRALEELQQNISYHHQWAQSLNRTLICSTPPKDETLSDNAHCLCRLGQWLQGQGSVYFGKHHNFSALLTHHKEMHDRARELALQAMAGKKISEVDYDCFLESLERLRTIIDGTYKELQDGIVQTDPLTGAATRLSMYESLQFILETMGEPNTDWLVMMDLDHFKSINDTYGHLMGDQVLAMIAKTVRSQIRSHDQFYRYGGEEFLLCLRGVDRTGISEIADRIRKLIEGKQFRSTDGSAFTVTTSMGIADLNPRRDVSEAVSRADAALYEAKRAGRNTIRIR